MQLNKKVLAIAIMAISTGAILNASPAYADDNKIDICHFSDNKAGTGQTISISEKDFKKSEYSKSNTLDYAGKCTTGTTVPASDKDTSDKKTESDKKDDSGKKGDSGKPESSKTDRSDSNFRGDAGETKKITICHVPQGAPEKKHTISIAASAWPAHKAHTGDHIGSCNNELSTASNPVATSENLHVIEGCTGSELTKLVTATQSYFSPIIVTDTALDNEAVAAAVSACLNKGDSSDSGHSGVKGDAKGAAHDSVSDSGNHHVIRGCENKGAKKTGDSGKADSNDANNFRKQLAKADSDYKKSVKAAGGTQDTRLVISDSSMDDSSVKAAYQSCVGSDSSHRNSGTSVKKDKGDSGHKFREVSGCTNDSDIRNAIKTHHDNAISAASHISSSAPVRPIVITESALTDTVVKSAVDGCLSHGAKETIVTEHTGNAGRLNWREKGR